MSTTSTKQSRFDARYTMVQYALGLLGVSIPMVNAFFPIRIFDGSLLIPTLASTILYAGTGILMALSAYARSRDYPLAYGLTTWATIIGAVVLYPPGTLAFIYWFGWVRKNESAVELSR